MHLQFWSSPTFPNPVLMRGWGDMGLSGLGQFIAGYDDPVTRRGWGGMWGLSAAQQQTGTTIASEAGAGAAATGALLATLAGQQIALLPAYFSLAGPIGAAVGAAVAIGVALAKIFSGCGQTCVAATAIANQIEPYLAQNVTNYIHTPVRFKSFQAAALNNFDFAWNALVKACSDPNLGDAGQRCITDRQRGSCKFKTSPGAGCPADQSNCWTQDASGHCTFNPGGPNGSGNACWDWFLGYRDPIANDPCVTPDPTAADAAGGMTAQQIAGAGPSVTLPGGTSLPMLALVGGGLILFGLMQ